MTSRDIVIRGDTTGFVSPGGSGEFPRLTKVLDPSLFASRGDLSKGIDSLFRPNAKGVLDYRIVIQGLNTVANHAAVVDILIPGELGIIHQITGRLAVQEARQSIEQDFSKPPILTGATRDSIHARLETNPDQVITDVGPTTFYSPLIEFGLAAHFKYGPRPFMTLAFAKVLPFHLQALQDLARVAALPRSSFRGKDHGPPANSYLAQFRAWLYTKEKQLGDIIPMGGAFDISLPGAPKLRTGLLGMARSLGDMQAVMSSAVGARFVRRLQGRVTGRLVGIGSNTVFAGRVVGARISLAEREYNKIALPAMTRFIGQSSLFGGMGG